MKTRILFAIAFVLLACISLQLIFSVNNNSLLTGKPIEHIEDGDEETPAAYHYLRWKYEADMIRDPITGEIPYGLREKEIEFAKTIPARNASGSFQARTSAQNTYLPAGPNNIGGRTRALAYDIRYDGTGNRVIISGSVSGGIFRTDDGGANWTRVSPQNEVHNVTTIVQDPRPGNQNTWYAGGGEYVGSSTDDLGAGYLAYGIYKSTDNGITWTRLPLTVTDIDATTLGAGVAERFDNPFDYTHKLLVNPQNGHLYVAAHRRLIRSTDGGATFQVVFGNPASAAFAANGQMDVTCSLTGKIYIAVSGSNPDLSLRGIWRSTTGNIGSWTRIAGGQTLGVDSVANWRGNAYSSQDAGGSPFYDTRRTLLALSLSNENILYVLYENGLLSSNAQKEADLFKLDMTSGDTWTNLSSNLPDFPGGNHIATDPFTIQGGYDLFITVKPDNPNFVILGGTSLYRSTNGFSSTSGTSWIGGYGNTLPTLSFYGQINNPTDPSKWSHPDIHNLAFNPSNLNEAICANDGGIQITSNITSTSPANEPVTWNYINNYQTLQYYHVAIDPGSGRNNFAGGAQDNGSRFRDKVGILGTAPVDSNNHVRLTGGDGGTVNISSLGISQYCYSTVQLGSLRRTRLQPSFASTTTEIRPDNLTTSSTDAGPDEYGEFVTNCRLDPDNTEDLYYVNFNRLFRTTSASTVTSSGWTELTGVSSTVNNTNGRNIGIRAMAFSRGPYLNTHSLYFGTTNGKIFRLDDPRNASASATPVNITPSTSVADLTNLNVQDIAVNPNNDNEILVVVSNYGRTSSTGVFSNVTNILWTNNAKSASPTWKKAEGNLTGTNSSGFISGRSCMIVVKKDGAGTAVTEYYVGTAAGLFAVENLDVTLLANGTPTWLREGSTVLNYSVIVALAYRPVDNVLLVGTHGNGMFYASVGTPNLVTGINDPILNDKTFISSVRPTISSSIVEYKTGNRFEIKKVAVVIYNMNGQEVFRKESGYQDGTVDISRYSRGLYILSITSDNMKYRHIQKIIR